MHDGQAPLITAAADMRQAALAFDYGRRRIGVAYANRQSGTATPLATVTEPQGVERDRILDRLFTEWQPDTIVIGVPYNMDGSESPTMAAAIEFATRLATLHALPVERLDERLTSAEAEALLREQRQSGQRRRKVRPADIDRMAAQLIAESWLREK